MDVLLLLLLLQDVIEGQIYPPLSAGFTDENAYIRELTLKSLLVLAPKMRQATLTQNLLKHLSRLQVRPLKPQLLDFKPSSNRLLLLLLLAGW